MITFEQFYKEFLLRENLYINNNFSVVYKHGTPSQTEIDRLKNKGYLQIANEYCKIIPVVGRNTADNFGNTTSRMFVGYLVDLIGNADVDEKNEKREELYAAAKGTGNKIEKLLSAGPANPANLGLTNIGRHPENSDFYKKSFTSMHYKYYNNFIDNAVEKFKDKLGIEYNIIAVPASRSKHVLQVAERLKRAVGSNDCRVVVIDKLTFSINQANSLFWNENENDNNFNPRTTNIRLDLTELGQSILDKYDQIHDFNKQEINDNIFNAALKQAVWEYSTSPARQGEYISTASHTRASLKQFMFMRVGEFYNEMVGGIILPTQQQLQIQDRNGNLVDRKIGGSADQNLGTHHLIDNFINFVVDNYLNRANNRPFINILFVDDNINSGDQFKQYSPMINKLANLEYAGNIEEAKLDWFFMFMKRDYLIKTAETGAPGMRKHLVGLPRPQQAPVQQPLAQPAQAQAAKEDNDTIDRLVQFFDNTRINSIFIPNVQDVGKLIIKAKEKYNKNQITNGMRRRAPETKVEKKGDRIKIEKT